MTIISAKTKKKLSLCVLFSYMALASKTYLLYYIVFIIILHFYIMQILNVAQHCFYGKFMSPVTKTSRQVFR